MHHFAPKFCKFSEITPDPPAPTLLGTVREWQFSGHHPMVERPDKFKNGSIGVHGGRFHVFDVLVFLGLRQTLTSITHDTAHASDVLAICKYNDSTHGISLLNTSHVVTTEESIILQNLSDIFLPLCWARHATAKRQAPCIHASLWQRTLWSTHLLQLYSSDTILEHIVGLCTPVNIRSFCKIS